jgi:hypothetical protein
VDENELNEEDDEATLEEEEKDEDMVTYKVTPH